MYKLIAFSALLALAVAAPQPSGIVYSSQVLTPAVPHVVSSVVSPAVTSYSSYSNSVVHGTPVVSVPVVRQAHVTHVVPLVQQAHAVHAVPYVYSEPAVVLA